MHFGILKIPNVASAFIYFKVFYMGIRIQSLDIIHKAASSCFTRGNLWAMGSQICSFSNSEANQWLRRNGFKTVIDSGWLENPTPIFQAMGFSDYIDVDINDQARRILDLTQTLPKDCNAVADMVLDSGTLEHIFELPTALRNMNRLLKPGGVIVHITPVTFFDHGFVNVNPSLYKRFYEVNGYKQLFMTFQITIHNPLRVPRISSSWMPPILARFNLPFGNHNRFDWVRSMLWLSSVARLPKNLLLVGAFQKRDDRKEFKIPSDVWID